MVAPCPAVTPAVTWQRRAGGGGDSDGGDGGMAALAEAMPVAVVERCNGLGGDGAGGGAGTGGGGGHRWWRWRTGGGRRRKWILRRLIGLTAEVVAVASKATMAKSRPLSPLPLAAFNTSAAWRAGGRMGRRWRRSGGEGQVSGRRWRSATALLRRGTGTAVQEVAGGLWRAFGRPAAPVVPARREDGRHRSRNLTCPACRSVTCSPSLVGGGGDGGGRRRWRRTAVATSHRQRSAPTAASGSAGMVRGHYEPLDGL